MAVTYREGSADSDRRRIRGRYDDEEEKEACSLVVVGKLLKVSVERVSASRSVVLDGLNEHLERVRGMEDDVLCMRSKIELEHRVRVVQGVNNVGFELCKV